MPNGNGEFDPGAGRLLGTNDLQATIDKFNTAVNTLTSTVANMSSTAANGVTRTPAASVGAGGAMFSAGQFPTMTQASFGGLTSWGTPSPSWPAGGSPGGWVGSGGRPLLGMMASGGGANAGGATVGGMVTAPPLGGGGQGGGPAGGGGSLASAAAGQIATSAAGVTQAFFTSGNSQLGNMQLFNAYGAQLQAQWGGSAQTYQNQAFGNGTNGITNAAAAGNAQSAAQEFSTLTQMAGGANVTGTAAFGATNALAFANQGLGAAGASQVSAAIYNPARALQQQLLTGVSAFGPNGQQASLSSQIMGLAGQGYIGGGSLSASGTFKQSALNASFVAGRGTSYMNLSSLGYSDSQIQDIQSTISQANQAAIRGKTSVSAVMGLMNTASYGSTSQIEGADKKLAGMGVDISTLQLQGNKSAQSLSQQQSQSSTYNDSVKDFTDAVQRVTQGFNWFLDKTGLGKVVGGIQGASAGAAATGVTGMIKAAMGGGAGSVSATSSMTSQGMSAGSSMSSVSGQARTAVRDAETQIGVPYQYGSETPGVGYDCSSLVQWSYGQAGVRLPRTSQQQWAALRNKSVPLNQVREGDIIFSAGSDGSLSAPGHEALMISGNQIIEAAHSGTNIRVRGFNPSEWQHAARPTGSVGRSGGTAGISGTQIGFAGSRLAAGNAGGGGSGDSSLGLTVNADDMLFSGVNGGGLSAGGMTAGAANGGSASSSTSGAGMQTGATGGRLSASAIESLWTSLGGPASAAANMARIADAESGDRPGIKQQGQPPGLTGWGLYQVTPTSGIRQDGQFGNLLNASNNTKAAISLYDHGGYSPWSSDPVGSSLTTAAMGGGAGSVSMTQPMTTARSPWSATPAQSLLLDMLSPANDHARGGGGVQVNVTVSPGAINVTGSGGGIGTASDIQAIQQGFESAVVRALSKHELLSNVMSGVT